VWLRQASAEMPDIAGTSKVLSFDDAQEGNQLEAILETDPGSSSSNSEAGAIEVRSDAEDDSEEESMYEVNDLRPEYFTFENER